MKLQPFIKTKMVKNEGIFGFKLLHVIFIMLINVKMPTIVGFLTFVSRINFELVNSGLDIMKLSERGVT